MIREGHAAGPRPTTKAVENYIKAVNKGMLKVMSKMGISTLQSYRGAQIFEAIGLNEDVRRPVLHLDAVAHRGHRPRRDRRGSAPAPRARASRSARSTVDALETGGQYQWRRDGEYHLFNPETVHKLQHADADEQYSVFKEYTEARQRPEPRAGTLRGLLRSEAGRHSPMPIDEVEPVEDDRQALRHRRDVATARSARRRTRPWPSP